MIDKKEPYVDFERKDNGDLGLTYVPIFKEGNHTYKSNTGKVFLSSVSSTLNIIEEFRYSPAMAEWIEPYIKKYVEDKILTQGHIDSLKDIRILMDKLMKEGMDKGTRVHFHFLEGYLNGKEVSIPKEDKEVLGMFVALKEWWDKKGSQIYKDYDLYIEQKVYSPTKGIAGTVDLILLHKFEKKRVKIGDLKTGSKTIDFKKKIEVFGVEKWVRTSWKETRLKFQVSLYGTLVEESGFDVEDEMFLISVYKKQRTILLVKGEEDEKTWETKVKKARKWLSEGISFKVSGETIFTSMKFLGRVNDIAVVDYPTEDGDTIIKMVGERYRISYLPLEHVPKKDEWEVLHKTFNRIDKDTISDLIETNDKTKKAKRKYIYDK